MAWPEEMIQNVWEKGQTVENNNLPNGEKTSAVLG